MVTTVSSSQWIKLLVIAKVAVLAILNATDTCEFYRAIRIAQNLFTQKYLLRLPEVKI